MQLCVLTVYQKHPECRSVVCYGQRAKAPERAVTITCAALLFTPGLFWTTKCIKVKCEIRASRRRLSAADE